MPSSTGQSTSSSTQGFSSGYRPRLCPRTRVYFAAEHIVLHARNVFYIHTGLNEVLSRSLRFLKDGKRSLLVIAGLAEDQRPADLGIVAVDLWSQFGGDVVALLESAVCRRPHAEHLCP